MGENTEKNEKRPNIVWVSKKIVPQSLSVTPVIVNTKTRCLLHFNPEYEIATQRFLPAKGIVEAVSSRFLYIFDNNTLTTPQKRHRHKVLGRLSDDIHNFINTGSQLSKSESPPKSVISTVVSK